MRQTTAADGLSETGDEPAAQEVSDTDLVEENWQIQFSNDTYAYGCIPVPVVAVGPTGGLHALVVGGNHGDEFEGQIIARRLLFELRSRRLRGRVTLLPSLNFPAVLAQSRTSPVDGQNLNRSFPGAAGAGPTSAIAWTVSEKLLPQCDFAIDLHSGGLASRWLPSGFVRLTSADSVQQREDKLTAARLLGLSDVLVVGEGSDDRSLSAQCDRAGVLSVAAELGGGATVESALVEQVLWGVLRLLGHWGLLEDDGTAHEDVQAPPRLLALRGGDQVVMSHWHGMLEPICEVGEEVDAGQALGRLYSLERPAAEPTVVRSTSPGVVAIRRLPPVVAPGDYLFTVAPAWRPE